MTFKTVWFSIDGNNLMREDFKMFIGDLRPYATKIELFNKGGKNSYVKVETDDKTWSNESLGRKLSGWVFYHPINLLKKTPNVSDYDKIDEFAVGELK